MMELPQRQISGVTLSLLHEKVANVIIDWILAIARIRFSPADVATVQWSAEGSMITLHLDKIRGGPGGTGGGTLVRFDANLQGTFDQYDIAAALVTEEE